MNRWIKLMKNVPDIRLFSTTIVKLMDPKKITEVKFPVPWGHIAGKWWGNKEVQPIIALHGGLDNANSFDNLLPLLDTVSVLCIDLPGHGLSSHLPPGVSLNYLDYLVHLRYMIITHFMMRDKICLLAHSLGSSLCFAYAGLYPDDIRWMINIECGRFSIIPKLSLMVEDARICYGFSDQASSPQGKNYSWENVVKYTYAGRQLWGLPLSLQSCEILAQRSVIEVAEDSFIFTLDERLKLRVIGLLTPSFIFALARRITCNCLDIRAKGGLALLPELNPQLSATDPQVLEKSLNEIKKNAFVQSVIVDGSHHVHLEQPKNISDIINDFVKSY